MQRTHNKHVSHARLVAGGGSCAPLMPNVMRLPVSKEFFGVNIDKLPITLIVLLLLSSSASPQQTNIPVVENNLYSGRCSLVLRKWIGNGENC